MAYRQDVATLPDSPEIRRRQFGRKSKFDGTNLPVVVRTSPHTTGGMNCRSPLAAIVCATSILLCASPARADSTSRSFVGNFIGNDATVENYLSVSGSYDRAQNAESL